MSCEECPKKAYRKTRVEAHGNLNAKYLLVGERPGGQEIVDGEFFRGRSGQVLKHTLREHGVSPEECYFDNACKCCIDSPKVGVINACREYLEETISKLPNLELIVALGAPAMKSLLPKEKKGITANCGHVREAYGKRVLMCLNPAAVTRDMRNFALFDNALSRMSTKFEPVDVDKTVINDRLGVMTMLHSLSTGKGNPVVVDVETTGLSFQNDRLINIGIYDGEFVGILEADFITPEVIRLLNRCNVITHNGTFDTKFLKAHTGMWLDIHDDTMLMAYMRNETFSGAEEGGYGLKRLASIYLDAPDYKSELEPYIKNKKDGYAHVPEDIMQRYLAKDVIYPYELWKRWKDSMPAVYRELVIPAFNSKTRIEYQGVHYDVAMKDAVKEPLLTRADDLRLEMCDIIGNKKFNPNSNPQVKNVAKQLTGRTPRKVDKEYVNRNDSHSFFRKLRAYRKCSKLVSTYLKGIKHDSRNFVHTTYNLHRTVTGRLSSVGPNLQNVPKGLHKLFIPDPGHKHIVGGDYAQLEYKVLIAKWGNREYVDKINNGYDIHEITSSNMTGRPLGGSFTKDERRRAKNVNFGIIFGMELAALAKWLCCGRSEALAFKQRYFGDFQEWKDAQIRRILSDKFARSMFGRKRRFPYITSENRAEVIREGFNHEIQGTATDVMLHAFVTLEENLPKMFNARMILTVHDEVWASVHENDAEDVAKYMKEVMEKRYDWSELTFTTDIEIKERW